MAGTFSLEGRKPLDFSCNPQRRIPVNYQDLGKHRRRAYLVLGDKIENPKKPDCYSRELFLKHNRVKTETIAEIQYQSGKALFYEGHRNGPQGRIDIFGDASDKTIWQIKKAVLTAYHRQYQAAITEYAKQLEILKGIKLNGNY